MFPRARPAFALKSNVIRKSRNVERLRFSPDSGSAQGRIRVYAAVYKFGWCIRTSCAMFVC